jgi:putative ABC transport system ATP-binding protein
MIRLDGVEFQYGRALDAFILRVPTMVIADGERWAIVGPSGCGKTTLLHLIAGIQLPRTGVITLDDVPLSTLPDADRRRIRITTIGLVFQEFELLEHLNVFENILLPYRIHASLRLTREVRSRAEHLADRVGIADKLRRPIHRLSQGERQRVAICRALVTQPRYLLADEPTGNLDPTLKLQIVDLLIDQLAQSGSTLVMVTHDASLLGRFDHVWEMNARPVETT